MLLIFLKISLFEFEFADDNYKLDENGRKFCKQVENTAGEGEIAC